MGISINIAVQLARVAPHLKDCRNGLMLGRQKMHFRPPEWTPRLLRELAALGIEAGPEDIFQEDDFCEAFLATIGFPPMESLDFTAAEGAEHIHDLSQPIPSRLKAKFDLIYDGGTTEHVFDIAQSFRNADAMLRTGGYFLSCVGTEGWFGHGFYQVGPDIPWRYWVASLGYEMIGCWTFSRRGTDRPRPIPDPALARRGAVHAYSVPQFLFYLVRKRRRRGAPAPVVQGHYA